MSHFTVLTAITLPEGVEDLLSQSSMQMSVCELVQATRSADIVNRIKTDTVKAETLRNQLQFENFIETLAGYRLEPYWENTEDPRYLVFSDCTEVMDGIKIRSTCIFARLRIWPWTSFAGKHTVSEATA